MLQGWRAWIIWGLQALMAAIVLVLLWQPAITVAELKPQQNIIAVLVDDSRSMGISEDGSTRQAQAVKALQGGLLASLENEAQLAFLLAREMAHVLDRDDLAAARYAALTPSLSARVKLARALETEADRSALLAIDRAGYDMAEAAHAGRRVSSWPEAFCRTAGGCGIWFSHCQGSFAFGDRPDGGAAPTVRSADVVGGAHFGRDQRQHGS